MTRYQPVFPTPPFFAYRRPIAFGILIGIILILLLPTAGRTQSACTSPYTVQRGDYLGKIAKACGLTTNALQTANPQITNPSLIEVGDRLVIPGAEQAPATPTPEPTSVPNTMQERLAGAVYSLTTVTSGYIRLREGTAQLQTATGALEIALNGPIANGDLDGDGVTDAATILREHTQGTIGYFYSLHTFVDRQGTLVESAAVLLGDRVQINSIQIQADGALVLDLLIEGPNDPMAGAAFHVLQTYRLRNGQLFLFAQTPVAEATDLGNATVVCPNTYATQLRLGGLAFILHDNPGDKYLRRQVGNDGKVIGTLAPGTSVSITAGPRCSNERVWWYVEANDGQAGWTSEGTPDRYFLWPLLDAGMDEDAIAQDYGSPITVVRAYYAAIDRGLATNDLQEAHAYWSAQRKAETTYTAFGNAYAETQDIVVHDVAIRSLAPRTATVVAIITTTDLQNGRAVDLHYETTYPLVVEDEQWRLGRPTIKEIDRPIVSNPVGGPANSFAGTWQTNFAAMTLTQTGTRVYGSYIQYSGNRPIEFSGTATNRVLTGTYANTDAIRFVLSQDGQSFTGYWMSNGKKYPWCGVRNGPLPDGCGFSGRWNTNHGTNGWVELEQTGNKVRGRYFTGDAEGTIDGTFSLYTNNQYYSITGTYQADNDRYDSGFIRFTLPNLDNSLFQGCYINTAVSNGKPGSWCGWPGQTGNCPRVTRCE